MYADELNPIIAKKSIKENWKIKGKTIYHKRDYCKIQIISNEENCRIKERIKMENSN